MSKFKRKYTAIRQLLVMSTGLFLWILNLPAAEAGKATGELIVNDQKTQFNYAYALAQPGYFDKNKEDILVILTDVPLSEEAIEDNFERRRMMRDSSLHCVEITINADKSPISVAILHSAFKAAPSGRGYEVFEAKTFDGKTIEGKVYTTKKNEFFGTTYEYSAYFKAQVYREVPPTPAEKEAASKSPQAAAYLKYEKTIKAGDFEELKKLVTKELVEEMSAPDAKEMFEFMQMAMPSSVQFLRVKVNGNKAVLELSAEQDGQKLSGKVDLFLDGTQWKIGQNRWKD